MAGRAALAHPSPVCLHGRGMRNSSHATNRAYAMSRASAVEESTQAESLDSLDDDEDDVSMSESMEAPLSIDTEDRDSVESARRRRRRRSRRSGHRVRSASTAGYRMASRKNRPRGAELRRVKRSMESAAGTGRRQSGSANTHGWKKDTLEIAAALGLDMGQAEMEGEVNNSLAEVTGSLAHFVNDIRATDVLTYEQERELTNYVTEYHHVERMREELEYNTKRAPSDSELATYSGKEEEDIKQTVFEGKLAKRLMVEYNLGLVVSMAKKFMHRGLQLDDLIQEGTFGLLKAIDRYDPDRGFKFSTYCFWWIRQALQKAIMGHTRTIRVPSGVYWNASQVLSAERRLTGEGKDPSEEALASETGLPVEKVQEARSAFHLVGTFGYSGSDKDERMAELRTDSTYGLVDKKNKPTTSEYSEQFEDNQQLSQDLEELLHTLSPRERAVLRMRYCLDNRAEPVSRPHLAKMFGVSKQRIGSIEQRALNKLADPEHAPKLLEHLRERELGANVSSRPGSTNA